MKVFDKLTYLVNQYIFNSYTFWSVAGLWFLFACVWTVLYKNNEWISDEGLYQYFATICYNHHTMYPDESFLHNECIINPGWINILILWLHVFKDFLGVPYLLLCLNAVNLLLLWIICKNLSERKSLRYIVLYSYILIPSFATNSITLLTEVPYITFSLSAFYLCLRNEYWPSILSGLLIGIALWIRPLADAWIVAALFLLISNKQYVKSILYSLSVAMTCVTIAICTHVNFPDYIYKTSSGGANLLIGANDAATGTYTFSPRGKGGAGYLSGLRTDIDTPVKSSNPNNTTYIKECSNIYRYDEVNRHYKLVAIDWIKKNPLKWISLIPTKIEYLLFKGTLEVKPLPYAKYNHPKLIRWMYKWQTFYVTFVMLVAISGLFFPSSWREKKIIYVVIPIIVASAMTCMCFGAPRFNYVFLPLILVYFAHSLIEIKGVILKLCRKYR